MIHELTIENFQGACGTFKLKQNNIITGQNGSGKTTLTKAVQLLLLKSVPGDEVNDKADEQYLAYCGESDGVMSITIKGDRGVLKRTWTRNQDQVSTHATFNDQMILAKTDFLSLMGLSIFNVTEFWRLSPTKQIAEICRIAGVHPQKLEELDYEIEKVQSLKKDSMFIHKNASSALKDHEVELQTLTQNARFEVGVNISNAENEIQQIDQEVLKLSNTIFRAKSNAAETKSRVDRIREIKLELDRNSFELAKLGKMEEMIDTTELEEEIKKLEQVKASLAKLEEQRQELKKLRQMRPPTPPAYKDEHVRDIQNKIIRAESGILNQEKVAYETSLQIFKEMGELSPILHEGERNQCLVTVYKYVELNRNSGLHQAKVELQDQIRDWKKQLANIQNLKAKYQKESLEFSFSNKLAEKLEREIESLENLEFDQGHFDGLINELENRQIEKHKVESNKIRRNDLVKKNSSLSRELDELENEHSESYQDVQALEQRKNDLEKTQGHLKEHIRLGIEYQKVNEIRERKALQVDTLSKEIEDLKLKENTLVQEKAGLLKQIKETLTNRAERVIRPARITFDLPESQKRNDRIKFWYHQGNGDKVERQTLCGSEQVEFDLALAYALVEKGGLICTEVAELTEDKMDHLVNKVTELQDHRNVQVFLVGHTLGRFEKDPRVAFVSMDQHIPPKLKHAM